MNISYYRRLKNVNRLGTEIIQRPYNLLEHSYMVTVLFCKFAREINIPYDTSTIDLLLHHDIVEVITGDLPYTVKNCNDITKSCWSNIEQEVLRSRPNLLPYTDDAIRSKMTPQQYELFKVCDLLDLWIFLREERGIGNLSIANHEIIKTCEDLIYGKFREIDEFMSDYILY